ncbi:MAG: GatB/YqeY domain-containing protein [Desulfobacterales bacterium]|nr:GatB/YqeY domain-containing protein [Desulfobacterales bacterium]
MSLAMKITEDLKGAIKTRDEFRLSCLRMLKAALKNEQVKKGRELNDEEIQAVISSLIRKGEEAIAEFRKGNREDLVQKEKREGEIFYQYLPAQLTAAEIEEVLREIITELSVSNLKDLGKVMKVAVARTAGRAQGKEVNEIARRLLG